MTGCRVRLNMNCCNRQQYAEDVAKLAILKFCDQYPGLIGARISCPSCREKGWLFDAEVIVLLRQLGAVEMKSNGEAELMAGLFRKKYPGVELFTAEPKRLEDKDLAALWKLRKELKCVASVPKNRLDRPAKKNAIFPWQFEIGMGEEPAEFTQKITQLQLESARRHLLHDLEAS